MVRQQIVSMTWRGLVAVLVLGLAVAGCSGATSGSIASAPTDLDTATTRLSDQGTFEVSYDSDLDPVAINKLHRWTLRVTTADGQPVEDAQLTVTGGMPQHNHGMPTTPQVTGHLGNGEYQVEGMKFQMPGWWTVTVKIAADGQQDSVTFNLVLP